MSLVDSKLSGAEPPKPMVLNLSAIKVDPNIQSRAGFHQRVIAQYAQRMEAGDKFPPLVVFEVDGVHLLADGFHRHPAAQKAGATSVPVEIHHGTRKDAIRFAIAANVAHGLPRTNKDKRRAVELALTEFPDYSDGAVAELCKVSQPFVSSVRSQLKTVMSCEPRTGRDGRKRKLPKAGTGIPNRQRESNHLAPAEPGVAEGHIHEAESAEAPNPDAPGADAAVNIKPFFAPSKLRHYSAEDSIYGLVLQALNISSHYELQEEAEERQNKLDELLKKYLPTWESSKQRKGLDYSVASATFGLLLTAPQVSLLNEAHPGADEWRSLLIELIEEYQTLCDKFASKGAPSP